jgi:tripartite-type tricarboxylate transporter receptor subunit TctC
MQRIGIGKRHLLLGAGAALAAPAIVRATDPWPTRAVKLIVPYAPGGAGDAIARPWAERLQAVFGQPFVVENRGGAAGGIGAEAAAKSAPDGYTFLATTSAPLTILPQLRKVGYDPRKDMTPIGRMGDTLGGFVTIAPLGFKTLADAVDHARKNPGKLAFGSSGPGSSTHMRLEMLKYRAGVDILHVPYRGSGDALTDLLAGHVQMMNEIVVLPHVKSGKLNLHATNHTHRNPDFPDTPTLTEAGYPNSDVPIWYSIWAPTGIAPEIVTRMNAAMVEIAKSAEMIRRLREINVLGAPMAPEDILAFYEADRAGNTRLIKEARITLD